MEMDQYLDFVSLLSVRCVLVIPIVCHRDAGPTAIWGACTFDCDHYDCRDSCFGTVRTTNGFRNCLMGGNILIFACNDSAVLQQSKTEPWHAHGERERGRLGQYNNKRAFPVTPTVPRLNGSDKLDVHCHTG